MFAPGKQTNLINTVNAYGHTMVGGRYVYIVIFFVCFSLLYCPDLSGFTGVYYLLLLYNNIFTQHLSRVVNTSTIVQAKNTPFSLLYTIFSFPTKHKKKMKKK